MNTLNEYYSLLSPIHVLRVIGITAKFSVSAQPSISCISCPTCSDTPSSSCWILWKKAILCTRCCNSAVSAMSSSLCHLNTSSLLFSPSRIFPCTCGCLPPLPLLVPANRLGLCLLVLVYSTARCICFCAWWLGLDPGLWPCLRLSSAVWDGSASMLRRLQVCRGAHRLEAVQSRSS